MSKKEERQAVKWKIETTVRFVVLAETMDAAANKAFDVLRKMCSDGSIADWGKVRVTTVKEGSGYD